jgi:hypothetical protein
MAYACATGCAYSVVEPVILQPGTYCPVCGTAYNPYLDVQSVYVEPVVYVDPLTAAVIAEEEIIIAEEGGYGIY